MKKWFGWSVIAAILLCFVIVGVALFPKFRNMKAEYGTAQAIGELIGHLQTNEGRWPWSAGELGDLWLTEDRVQIDYSVTSEELLADPERLRQAVRPKSGKFLTYPHY